MQPLEKLEIPRATNGNGEFLARLSQPANDLNLLMKLPGFNKKQKNVYHGFLGALYVPQRGFVCDTARSLELYGSGYECMCRR